MKDFNGCLHTMRLKGLIAYVLEEAWNGLGSTKRTRKPFTNRVVLLNTVKVTRRTSYNIACCHIAYHQKIPRYMVCYNTIDHCSTVYKVRVYSIVQYAAL